MNIARIYQQLTKFFAISFVSILAPISLAAQPSRIYTQRTDIQTIEFTRADHPRSNPVVTLGSGEALALSFDVIDGNLSTLYFSFQHCNFDWNPSDLLPVEYFNGFNKEYGYEQSVFSINTTVDYLHYQLIIPTNNIIHSGNYIISLYDENGTPLLTRPFWVVEPLVNITTELKRYVQQPYSTHTLDVNVAYGNMKIDVPQRQVHLAVWKDDDIEDAIISSQPSYLRSGELTFMNQFSFAPGNEYLWADTRSIRATRAGVARIDFIDPFYHITFETDRKPLGYSYHKDFNGKYHIENADLAGADPASQADYVVAHFSYDARNNMVDSYPPENFPVYLYGQLTNYSLDDRYRMVYDEESGLYLLDIRLKQGYYNYDYVTIRDGHIMPISSFIDTETNYNIAVYYRDFAGLSDRLIGFSTHNSLNSPNNFVR